MNINELYDRARAGEQAAEERLFAHLTVSFRLFAQQRIWDKADAEEIVQEALMVIADKYLELEIESSFSAWAYRVVHNKIMDFTKTSKKRAELLERETAANPGETAWRPDPLLRIQLMRCFHKIDAVNRRHARILNLYYQGYSTTEICEKLKMTPNHFYVTLSRARSMLEVCLEKGEVT